MKRHLLSLLAITLMIATTIQAQIPTNGLVAYYPFSGNANDASGNGNNGTNNGAALTSDRFGKPNSAYLFTANPQNITIPNLHENNILTYSVSGWFQKSSTSINQEGTIFAGDQPLGNSSISGLRFDIGSINRAQFGVENGNNVNGVIQNVSGDTTNYSDNKWHSFAVTFNSTKGLILGSNFKIYIDGNIVKTLTYQQNWPTWTNLNVNAPLNNDTLPTIFGNVSGSYYTLNDVFLGKLDDIRIYNRVLDSVEVKALYHEGGYDTATNGIPTNGLVAWYPFTGNAIDSSGNGNNGTVNKAASLSTDRFGNANSAYSFTNANGGISVPSFKALDSNYTISYWANYSSSVINTSISDLSHDWQNNGFINLFRDLSNILTDATPGTNGTSNNISIQSPNPLSLNRWYNITAIRNGSKLQLYVNGKLQISGSNSIFNTISAKTLFIGGDPNEVKQNPDAAFNGKLDDIRIYNRSLDSTEIQSLYHEGGYDIPCTGIFGFNPLQDTIRACGDNFILDAGTGYSGYSWSTGETTQTITAKQSGNFKVTVNNAVGCSARDSGYVSIVKAKILNKDTTICKGGSVVLTVPQTKHIKVNTSVMYLPNSTTYIEDTTKWHYIALTKSGAVGKFYYDGNLVTSSTFDNVPYIWNSLLLAATQGCVFCAPVPNYDGYIDEVRVSNVVRSSTEIINAFNSNSPFNSDVSTIGLFHFDTINVSSTSNSIGGNATIYGNPNLTNGKFGKAIKFNGTTDYVRWSNSIPTSNMSLEFWYKSPDTTGTLAMLEYAYNTGISLGNTSVNNTIRWSTGESTTSITVTPTKTTTYYLTVSDDISSCTDSVTITVIDTTSIPKNGLIAWYPFSGNTLDSSGNGNHGTNNGATLTTDRFDKANSAYVFDGISNSIAFPQTFIFNQLGDGTVSIWLKNDSILSQIYSTFIYSRTTSSADLNRFNFYLQPLSSNKNIRLTIDYRDSVNTLHILDTSNSIINHDWNNMIISRSGSTYSFYLNGVLACKKNDSNVNLPNQIGWLIGKNACVSRNFKGSLDDIRLYNRALDSTEVKALYHEGGYDATTSSIPKNGLVAWYPFNGNTLDSSGNNNHGTNNGATLTTDRFGKANSAYNFTGDTNFIHSNLNTFVDAANSVTFSGWAYLNTNKGGTYIHLGVDGHGGCNGIGIGNGNPSYVDTGLNLTTLESCKGWYPTTYKVDSKKWFHFVISKNGNTIFYYLNGILKGSQTVDSVINPDKNLYIGSSADNEFFFNGKLDDIRIYKRALDSSEVKALYHEGGYNGTTLPVTLSNFAATTNGNNVMLNWLTAIELNTNHFIIQHSVDGYNFTNIGTINAIGSGANKYEFTDKNPANGSNYYRLQSVDKDGAISYSKVVSVQFINGSNHFTVYPNPVRNTLTISGEHISKVQILDNMGRIVSLQSLQDATNPSLSISYLLNGVYHVRIQTTDNTTNLIGFIKR